MKTAKSKETKFIATVSGNKLKHIDKIAKDLIKDGVKVDNVSQMFGIINGKSKSTLNELKIKYKSKGILIESDREVSL